MSHKTYLLEKYKSFISGAGRIPNGMSYFDAIDFESNEARHDFFQWLFPIETESHMRIPI